ncbi:unannotated protein [freshwater metagenome]|uniref:Unannotated protein n=1 Tax=freshwater metagenome TaxID=449393 RepID=A0A6J6X7W7_9ZZZZ
MTSSRSNTASSSVASSRQSATALSQSAPFGAYGRPLRYSKVTSSGATSPARAPASIDMLQRVMRPSIESERIADPRYSTTEPIPPPVPSAAMIVSVTSFAVTPSGSLPSTVTARVPGRAWGSVCVARTCSTSLVPIPNASAPKAPCVDVWLSPQTMVIPGCVRPCSGPMTCTMPWPGCPIAWQRTPNSSQLRASVSIWIRETESFTPIERSLSPQTRATSVGTL